MKNLEELLTFVEELIEEKNGNSLSDIQRIVLLTTLEDNRKTYDQIAEESGYSTKYLRQDIAPKLWQLLSEILNKRITKFNVKNILESQINYYKPMVSSPTVSDSLKTNILVVDDQPRNLKLLSHLLEEEGYEVQQAINGKVALKALTKSSPDIILLDIHMPDLDGYTVCQKIKTAPKTQDIPVIFVTALNESWDKVKGFSVGGSDYITKPFKIIEVLARVENQLKVRQLQLKVRELEKENQELKAGLQKFKN